MTTAVRLPGRTGAASRGDAHTVRVRCASASTRAAAARAASLHRNQRGLTLLFALILLVLLTLFGVSAVQILGVNLRIASNMASQEAAEASAQQGIETFISDFQYFENPPAGDTTLNLPSGTNTKFAVVVKRPKCIAESPAKGYSLTYGLAPRDTMWELQANTSDTVLGGKAEVHEGVSVLMVAGSCK
jgi:hypothetical protein